jgi:hypothetical protein
MVDKFGRFLIVILFMFSVWVVVKNRINVSQIDKSNKIVVDSLRNAIDSLNNELFIQQTNITRYEIALGQLKEIDSISAKKFEDKLYNIE